MVNVNIREAVVADCDELSVLFNHYRTFYGKEINVELSTRFIKERLEIGDSKLFVASLEAEFCGFLQIYPSFSSLGLGRTWVINDLYVLGNFRKIGIGRNLMEYAYRQAEKSGVLSLVLETSSDNMDARNLYEKIGYHREEQFITYHKSVE